jgi:sulfate permease, SulP family
VAAGLTVAVVALPLSMAIAIASGVTPDRGLYTAIIGGFTVSAFGGSRFQIGGPAGAFIVLVLTTVQAHGVDGLITATMLSGAIMASVGYLRLGTIIKFMPYPVMVGFTSGVAIVIFTSQIKDLLGMSLSVPEPGALVPKLAALVQALSSVRLPAVATSVLTIAIVGLCRRFRPHWPGMLIAVVVVSFLSFALNMPVDTIGSRFGGIPQTLPVPSLPLMSFDLIAGV